MPFSALGLLITAAMLHAVWNLFVKRAREKQVFTWCALVAGSICFAPLLVQALSFPASIWPYVVSSGLIEALYYLALIGAYGIGDFSLVYPLARGSAPAFLTLWALLFLGERPRPFGLLGIGLLVAGLIVIGGTGWWRLRKIAAPGSGAMLLALGAALCISIYSAIDGAAVQHVAPLPYTVLVIGLSALFVAPVVFLRYGGSVVIAEVRAHGPRIVVVGLLMLLTYMLVLLAYTLTRVSYGGAVREVSVVFAALLGWRLLGEDFGNVRLLGALLIFVGILIIAVGG